MKIVLLTPGAGDNTYCENCMRDAALLRRLRQEGHQALAAPLYLPPAAGMSAAEAAGPLFFGGVNVYLQQKLGLFRHSPRWLDRLFDARWLLRLAGRRTGMTDPHLLGEMTLSMLAGEHGRQAKELRRLGAALGRERPDVLLFSNALLIGMAAYLKDRTGAAAVCWLQDEDHFLDALPRPCNDKAWRLLAERSAHVDLFLAPSNYYRDVMIRRLNLPPQRVALLRQGVEPSPAPPPSTTPSGPFAQARGRTIGFLSQFSADKGLDLLVEAMALLRDHHGLDGLRLLADGGQDAACKPFMRELRRRVSELGLDGDVEIWHRFDSHCRELLMGDIGVLCVPSRQPEAWGLNILQALSAGVPVVMPDHGGQAELVRLTGGGLLFPPGDAAALAAALRKLLENPAHAVETGARGRQAVAEQLTLARSAQGLIALCARLRHGEPARSN